MADLVSSEDSDADIPGSETADVSHADVGFKKFFSSVKKLSKRVASLSDSPVPSPTVSRDDTVLPIDTRPDAFFGDVFVDPRKTRTTNRSSDEYDFNYKSRGVAVLIVNVNFKNPKMTPDREYAKHDIEVFQKILKALNFTIIKLRDLSTSDLRKELEKIRSTLTSDCDCFLCLISSHGLETRIYEDKRKRQHMTFTYDRWIPTDEIIKPFTESCCRCLGGKPKLFFIQACRSVHSSADIDSIDSGVSVTYAVRQPTGHSRDSRDVPSKIDKVDNLHPSLRSVQGDQNISSENSSQSFRGEVNLDGIPFADDDDTDDSDDQDLSTPDNTRVPYYPPRTHQADDVDFCTIPCYPHCLVMFSSAPERFAWSDDFKGGWLPYCMYKVLDKMAQLNFRIDLLEALTDVNETMAQSLETNITRDRVMHQRKSAACIYHMLTKDIYLTPKYAPIPKVDRVQVSAV
ncbi:uncharacterized protein LOC132546358 [Ylistrum balloti]|uniref:uncharacterized protein LOC132546358 n=1 Tax=Ylistrum balloti TaxID=509963 RepID=UPI002905C70F|nr:uncharacterized protein LOC132546358 [Ylistrum balloti]